MRASAGHRGANADSPDPPPSRSFAQGTKGTGGAIIILEEAARIDPQLFKETIVPLLLVEHTTLIGITTPLDEGNEYNIMMDLKYSNGKPMFTSLKITIMCEECRKQGLMTCPHSENEIPPWKRDKRRGELVREIMKNDRALYLRENSGVVQALDNKAFDPKHVDAAFDYPRVNVRAMPPSEVFVCVDTAGGGQSCTAVCTGYYPTPGKLVVLGALSLVLSNDSELSAALEAHLTRVRAAVGQNCRMISVVEANFGGWVYASRVAAVVDKFQPAMHMTSSNNRNIGVWLTADVKECMRVMFADKLRSERFAFAEPFIDGSENVLEELKRQLKAYKYEVKQTELCVRRVLSGKATNHNDDLCITVQMLAFWPSCYHGNRNMVRFFSG